MAAPTFERMEEATVTVDAIGRAGIELRVKVADEISELAAGFQHICRQRCSVTNPLWSNRTMRFATLMGIAALVAAPVGFVLADDALSLDSDTARINYSLGHQIGNDLKRQGIEWSEPAMVKGIEDAISDTEPMMKPEEMLSTLMELKRTIVAEQKQKAEEQAMATAEEGENFLDENAKKPGVVTTKSGLQYQILEEGSGKSPSATDTVTVNYRGTRIDGAEFDSSYKRGNPLSFPLNGVVQGWTEGLQLIKEGGKIKLFIPPELAYGNRGPLANQTLVFDVELISVGEPERASQSAAAEAEPKAEQ
jgi:FKBP-type peptidyl-prolyl cis-trans isomerase